MSDLSVVILSYNTKAVTLQCLEALAASKLNGYTVEGIVVDNASTDGSAEAVKAFQKKITSENLRWLLIQNQSNLGFSAGNNRGIRLAKGRYVLLLNSDVLVSPQALAKQIAFMEKHPEFAASTCKVELSNGCLDSACHRGFPTPWASFTYFLKLEKLFARTKLFGQYHQGWKDMSKIHPVDAVSGAFLMVRKEIFDTIGLLDEGFFMYAEDLDFCLRMSQKNMQIGFNPEVSVLHLKGASGRKNKEKKRSKADYYFWDTMKLFYQKHYTKKYPSFLRFVIYKVLDVKKGKLPS